MAVRLGCIADDLTGATDLANNLVRAGMRVAQMIGTPEESRGTGVDADAVIIALKSRTIAAAAAVEQSLEALAWLQAAGAEQIYFKYCSTFDSTPAGNIGPVTEALMRALGTDFTIAAPAFPDNGRTVFKGHLFVGDLLLSESGMKNHPLTPMTDSNLVNVAAAQCSSKVGLLDHTVVGDSPEAIRKRIAELRADGVRIAIVDAVSNDDLLQLGRAVADLPLVTAGSGVAIGLPPNWGIPSSGDAAVLPPASGHRAIVSGSVSGTTNRQVLHYLRRGLPGFIVDPLRIARGEDVVGAALTYADAHLGNGPVLVYSTDQAAAIRFVQGRLGAVEAGGLVERTLASIAGGLVERGVRQLVVAGGETSGAVIRALGVSELRIGAQIDVGVPWCAAPLPGGDTLHITLKSGNFGSSDFFTKAFTALDGCAA